MNYHALYLQLSQNSTYKQWLINLPTQLTNIIDNSNHGNMSKWTSAISNLPDIQASQYEINSACIRIGTPSDCDELSHDILLQQLIKLKPWRKGPYQLFDCTIDTEWRSDWKWDRLSGHISSLQGKTVLDVGCGNGYHCWRMAGNGAKLVVGIDPSLLFVMQYQTMKKYLKDINVFVLPLRLEEMPMDLPAFDTVFSMGVLYHRRSPFDHLIELRNKLRPGGELILETLIVRGDRNTVLVPTDRYAKMNNVWFLPSSENMINWLKKAGFKNAKLISIDQTSQQEQRRTKWMEFESLKDFLNPHDPNLTVEGYPAPTRGIFIAETQQ